MFSTASATHAPSLAIVFSKGYKLHTTNLAQRKDNLKPIFYPRMKCYFTTLKALLFSNNDKW